MTNKNETKILELDYKGEIIKGPLLKEDTNYYMIKLNSGYNANLKKSNCKIISETQTKQTPQPKTQTKKPNKNLPNITILHTGGTIASKIDYRTGAVSSKFTPKELLTLFPELDELANIKAKMIGNLFSEDMRFQEYNLIQKEIEKEIQNGADGIIIGHGTDTIHYTSSALQYAIQNLSIPIILVGAQRSSDRASSDSFSNLQAATKFIIENKKQEKKTNKKFNRVGICMHETINDNSFLILDGINAKKMHSTQRDAFKQINYQPYAKINETGNLTILRPELQTKTPSQQIKTTEFKEELKICFFKSHPNMFDWELDHLTQYDAVILEGTGIGNIPESNDNSKKDKLILKKLHEICDKTKIFAGVQTVYGEVSLDIYSRGRDIQDAGVIGNRTNLTTETTFCRVAYCLSQTEKEFDKIWEQNLEKFDLKSKQI